MVRAANQVRAQRMSLPTAGPSASRPRSLRCHDSRRATAPVAPSAYGDRWRLSRSRPAAKFRRAGRRLRQQVRRGLDELRSRCYVLECWHGNDTLGDLVGGQAGSCSASPAVSRKISSASWSEAVTPSLSCTPTTTCSPPGSPRPTTPQEHRGVTQDGFFHQVRVHGAARSGDPVTGPVGVVQKAVLIEESDVVGAEPVTGEERLSVLFRQGPVLTQRHRAAYDDLADLSGA